MARWFLKQLIVLENNVLAVENMNQWYYSNIILEATRMGELIASYYFIIAWEFIAVLTPHQD